MKNSNGNPKDIEYFREGDGRTPLSAETMNEMIRVLNRINHLQAGRGIDISISDYNIIISLSNDSNSPGQTYKNVSNFSGSVSGSSSTTCMCKYV